MLRDPAGRGSNGRSVMAANIVEGTQLLIRSTNNNERLAGQIEGKELARLGCLIHSPHRNPVAAKNLVALQALDALVHIPGSRDGVGVFERRVLIVKAQ